MLLIISPAKTIDFKNPKTSLQYSEPEFRSESLELINDLKQLSIPEITDLMKVSISLAELNYERYQNWSDKPDKELTRRAICCYRGEVFNGLDVDDWSDDDFNFSQEHIRILSGLYGVLRPLDMIQAYRLEMGTRFKTSNDKNLYKFWGDKITDSLQNQLTGNGDNILVNLASHEYYKSVNTKKLNAKIITPVFKDFKDGEYRVFAIYAKRARGEMARFIVKNKITNIEDIKGFDKRGFLYNDRLSSDSEWVFTRD